MKKAAVTIELEEHFSPQMLREVEKSFSEDNGFRLLCVLQSILLTDPNSYFEKFDPDVTLECIADRSKFKIVIKGLPAEKLIFGKLIRIKEKQVLCGIRDFFFSRQYPLSTGSGISRSEEITDYIFNFIKNGDLLSKKDESSNPIGRVMIQGGHHIPRSEKVHHKRLGFGLGLLGLELITGSGPGSMEDPMKGAIRGYQMNDFRDKKFIGLTEDGIITGEPCNEYVDHLIIFPDIEKRLEAFIRMSRAGLILPGGVGTFEEILTILWIKTHPRNKERIFPIYFCEPVQSNGYFKKILDFLNFCFDKDFVEEGLVKYYLSDSVSREDSAADPKRIALALYEEMAENSRILQRKPNFESSSLLWNWDIYFPEQLQHPLKITPEFIGSLEFRKGMAIEDLFYSLRSISSAIVECNVRDRHFLDKYGQFEIRGDREMLRALDEIFEMFSSEKRMGRREYRCPYKIVGN